jgi:Tfp pilus assembly protein PilP
VAPVVPKAKPSAKQTVAGAAATSAKAENEESLPPDTKYAANGRRDPFISPVVSHTSSSSCTSGKKCLEIGAINLKGVVHGESGFIAVVSNGLNKAYFLRENDPVFNGYVVKITGDSIVFQETLQDRLGKSFTREVVKKITTPAV